MAQPQFKLKKFKEFYHVQIIGNLEEVEIDVIQKELLEILEDPLNIVIDIFFLENINVNWFLLFNFVAGQVKLETSGGKQLCIIFNPPMLATKIKLNTVVDQKYFVRNLYDALEFFDQKEITSSSSLTPLQIFTYGVERSIFQELGSIASRRLITFKRELKHQMKGVNSGTLHIKSTQKDYLISITFHEKTCEKLGEKLTAEKRKNIIEQIFAFSNKLLPPMLQGKASGDTLLGDDGDYSILQKRMTGDLKNYNLEAGNFLVVSYACSTIGQVFLEFGFPHYSQDEINHFLNS